jgi:autotransporter passenger strand-loop-strand repeat protein/autotransporter-associated beta strand protein
LGAGGDIFVQQGGSLTIEGGALGSGTVTGGSAGPSYTLAEAGRAYGDGIFLQGNQAQILEATAGNTLTVSDAITDETGSQDPSGDQGAGALIISGPGTVALDAVDTYTGGTTIESGTLLLGAAGAAGSGVITFGTAPAALDFTAADAPTQSIAGFALNDTIDITDLGFAGLTPSRTGDTLVLSGSDATVSLSFTDNTEFDILADGTGGTVIERLAGAPDYVASSGLAVATLGSGDTLTVLGGATAVDTMVSDGGTIILSSGSFDSATDIGSGGLEIVSSGGVAISPTVSAGGTFALAGGTVFDLTVGSGSTQVILSGGSNSAAVVSSGGVEIVSSGGVASDTTVLAGGTMIFAGGTTPGLIIGSATTEIVTNGVTSTGLTIGDIFPALLVVASGGVVSETDVGYNGSVIVSNGGVAAGTVDFTGGFVAVSSGGTTIGTQVQDDAGEGLSAGGLALSTVVSSGGQETVYSGGTASKTLILSGGGQTVDGTASGTTISGGTETIVDEGVSSDTIVKSGGYEFVSKGSTRYSVISSGGSEVVSSGGFAIGATISTGGVEYVSAGGTTDATVIAGGTLVLNAAATATDGISFSGTGGVLRAQGTTTNDTISGFATGDAIDLTSLNNDTISSLYFDNQSDVLTIDYMSGGSDASLTLQFPGNYDNATFAHSGDGDFGTTITVTVCYFAGTRIGTPSGAVAVETLLIGDPVVTSDGRILPVRWIGRNTVSTRFADPLRVLPIRIRAGALADGMPERDLLVSPEHAILVEDILVQAAALVNGVSIIRERQVPERFVYYHVELSEHALILAEGTPAETFVDNIHRAAFDNWREHEALYGAAPIEEMNLSPCPVAPAGASRDPCAPHDAPRQQPRRANRLRHRPGVLGRNAHHRRKARENLWRTGREGVAAPHAVIGQEVAHHPASGLDHC